MSIYVTPDYTGFGHHSRDGETITSTGFRLISVSDSTLVDCIELFTETYIEYHKQKRLGSNNNPEHSPEIACKVFKLICDLRLDKLNSPYNFSCQSDEHAYFISKMFAIEPYLDRVTGNELREKETGVDTSYFKRLLRTTKPSVLKKKIAISHQVAHMSSVDLLSNKRGLETLMTYIEVILGCGDN